jgi:hypothetical protein
VASYGANCALWDEWQEVPSILGNEPFQESLWKPIAEHRVPLARLILFGLARASNYDFRAGMFASAGLLASISFLLVRSAQRLRGAPSYADLFFPLACMHFGHDWNLLEGWNIQNALFLFMAGSLLIVLAGSARLSFGRAVLAATIVAMLPLDGGAGLLVALAVGSWLFIGALARWLWHGRQSDWSDYFLIGVGPLIFLQIYAYLSGLQASPLGYRPTSATVVRGALKILGMAFGQAAQVFRPFFSIAALIFVVFAGGFLLTLWIKKPGERYRSLGLLVYLCAQLGLSIAISYGRSGLRPEACFQSRYSILALPTLCCAFFCGGLFGPWTGGRLLQYGLLATMCAALPSNMAGGLKVAERHREASEAFAKDVRAGIPGPLLIYRSSWLVPSFNSEVLPVEQYQLAVDRVEDLRRAGVGIYRQVVPTPKLEQMTVALKPTALNNMTWKDGGAHGWGKDSWMSFALEPPRMVYSILLDCSCNYGNTESTPVALQVAWNPSDDPSTERTEERKFTTRAGFSIVPFWVNQRIGRFRIRSDDKPCVLHIARILIEVPAE